MCIFLTYFDETGVDVTAAASCDLDTAVIKRIDISVTVQISIFNLLGIRDAEISRLLSYFLKWNIKHALDCHKQK